MRHLKIKLGEPSMCRTLKQLIHNQEHKPCGLTRQTLICSLDVQEDVLALETDQCKIYQLTKVRMFIYFVRSQQQARCCEAFDHLLTDRQFLPDRQFDILNLNCIKSLNDCFGKGVHFLIPVLMTTFRF